MRQFDCAENQNVRRMIVENLELEGLEFMGNNVRDKLKYCGKDVRIYPLAKIAKAEVVELDDNCQLFDFVFIYGGGFVKIGKYSTIAFQALIEGFGETDIGDRVLIGVGVKIITSVNEHNGFRMVDHLSEGQAKLIIGRTTIGDDVSIGAGSIILPKVTIGEGVVIGANSLVTKDLDPWGIYVGSPCRKIGDRQKPDF
jgi:acetyltransferase-like isoleucine patch superfamily enzyme